MSFISNGQLINKFGPCLPFFEEKNERTNQQCIRIQEANKHAVRSI